MANYSVYSKENEPMQVPVTEPEFCESCQHNDREEGYEGEKSTQKITGEVKVKGRRWESFCLFVCDDHAEIILEDLEYQGEELRNLRDAAL